LGSPEDALNRIPNHDLKINSFPRKCKTLYRITYFYLVFTRSWLTLDLEKSTNHFPQQKDTHMMKPAFSRLYALSAALFVFFCPALKAELSEPIEIPRVAEPIKLDGLSFESAWKTVEPWSAFQFVPNNGEPATERTEFLAAYDTDYIYLALRAFDSDPSGIRANTLYRDRLSGDDHFEFLLDTFNNNETAALFTTTPAGIRKDSEISNDASGGGLTSGGWINSDYNTYWDVATKITDQGWFAEIRIPFSSLRFQDENGAVTMGIILQRKIARKTERVVFPAVPQTTDFAFLKPSMAQKIILRDVHSSNPIYITPYGLSGLERLAQFDGASMHSGYSNSTKNEIGLDVKYNVSNRMTLDITANTDFAQVEADDKQVNLTRFSLFFPEKRQFFQERESLFSFRMGQYGRLFHSRKIGLTDDGIPVRILGGARLVGRIGEWDFGFMDMQTEKSHGLLSENFGVLRMRRQVLNDYSYAGFMATSRLNTNGRYNYAYGVDGVFRLFGDDYFTLRAAQTFDDSISPERSFDSGYLTAQLERRRRQGWGYRSIVAAMGPAYNPGIGFAQRQDFVQVEQSVQYSWVPGEDSRLIYQTLDVTGFAYIRNSDDEIESGQIQAEWKYSFKSGQNAGLQASMMQEDLLQPFSLSESAQVPTGNYSFWQIGGYYYMTHTALKQIGGSIHAGTFYDGHQYSLSLRPRWYVSKHLELSGEYYYVLVDFPDRDQQFESHIGRLRIGAALNTKLSTNAFIQYNRVNESLSANIRFRYNFREGNDLWIVFNNDVGGFDPLSRFSDAFSRNRTILGKYTYTFKM
jgi:hypothetical protein